MQIQSIDTKKDVNKEHLRSESTICTFGSIGRLAPVISLSLVVHNVQGRMSITTYRGTEMQKLSNLLDCLIIDAFKNFASHESTAVAASFDCQ